MQPDRELIFVYNLDKGSLSDVKDHLYSTVPNRPPPCNLCNLVSTPVGMKKAWKRFIADLGIPAEYLFREEFGREYTLPGFAAPGVFVRMGGSLILLVSSEEINRCDSINVFIDLVRQRIQKYLV